MRAYQQYCGVAKALDLVGERWTLLIVRNLIPGGQRYSDLMLGLPGITTNLLAKRLKHLVEHGLVEKRTLPAPARSTVYVLTALGRSLEPAVLALGAFGAQFMTGPPAGEYTDMRWAMVSLKRRFNGAALQKTVVFVVDAQPYTVTFGPSGIDVSDAAHPAPDATMTGSKMAIAGWMMGRAAADLVAAGAVQVEGAVQAFDALAAAL